MTEMMSRGDNMTRVIKERIQLKNDTEANWNKARNFIPLKGEVIIYSTDDTHPFSRIKIGDGTTPVIDLPFIDATSINGTSMRSNTEEYWSHQINYIPKNGEIIVYYNRQSDSEKAGIKVGDGSSYVVDLPFIGELNNNDFYDHINNTAIHVSESDRIFWNNKINCDDNIIHENLLLNRN